MQKRVRLCALDLIIFKATSPPLCQSNFQKLVKLQWNIQTLFKRHVHMDKRQLQEVQWMIKFDRCVQKVLPDFRLKVLQISNEDGSH